MLATRTRHNLLFPVIIIVVASSFGTVMSLHIAPGILGKTIYFFCHLLMLAVPLVWYIWSDRPPGSAKGDRSTIKISPPKSKELLAGTILGLLMFGAILAAYWFVGRSWIDLESIRMRAQQAGTGNASIYLVGAIYFSFVNSLFEEYIWRWFIASQCAIIIPGIRAIFLSALLFTLHHIIGLAAYVDWRVVLVGSLGVFVGGVIWSWCYLTYRSIWSSYISHILADLAIAIVGWQLLFGR
ncbi:CPBP family intramembrane metalloprotease [Candidatus Gracilibacteria bacterium]|nr:CPBP family intramembrane metalloprotease [Candidatus Gracilibacteria bacterium]NJP18184.1 CPBP family intramembrane metalloprotease [Hydrococcus sp. CRU_1_1]